MYYILKPSNHLPNNFNKLAIEFVNPEIIAMINRQKQYVSQFYAFNGCLYVDIKNIGIMEVLAKTDDEHKVEDTDNETIVINRVEDIEDKSLKWADYPTLMASHRKFKEALPDELKRNYDYFCEILANKKFSKEEPEFRIEITNVATGAWAILFVMQYNEQIPVVIFHPEIQAVIHNRWPQLEHVYINKGKTYVVNDEIVYRFAIRHKNK